MGRELTIAETLFHYHQKLIKHYPRESIMGLFLYGSQNYGFDTPDSDIDAKAIYIPTYEEMVNLKEPVSKVYETEYGNIEVKDIRLMWKMWKKQNINFIEILFTDYYLTNKDYTEIWEQIRFYKGQIARYNPLYTVRSIIGQTQGTLAYRELTGKKIANVARLTDFLIKYLNGNSYSSCIQVSDNFRKEWLPVKRQEIPEANVVQKLSELGEELNYLREKGERLFKDSKFDTIFLDNFMTTKICDAIELRKKLKAQNLTF